MQVLRNEGYGLLQVMVAGAIFSFITLAILQMMQTINKQQAGVELRDNVRELVADIETIIKNPDLCKMNFEGFRYEELGVHRIPTLFLPGYDGNERKLVARPGQDYGRFKIKELFFKVEGSPLSTGDDQSTEHIGKLELQVERNLKANALGSKFFKRQFLLTLRSERIEKSRDKKLFHVRECVGMPSRGGSDPKVLSKEVKDLSKELARARTDFRDDEAQYESMFQKYIDAFQRGMDRVDNRMRSEDRSHLNTMKFISNQIEETLVKIGDVKAEIVRTQLSSGSGISKKYRLQRLMADLARYEAELSEQEKKRTLQRIRHEEELARLEEQREDLRKDFAKAKEDLDDGIEKDRKKYDDTIAKLRDGNHEFLADSYYVPKDQHSEFGVKIYHWGPSDSKQPISDSIEKVSAHDTWK